MKPVDLDGYPIARVPRMPRKFEDPWSVMRGIALMSTVIQNTLGFTDFIVQLYAQRCEFCGYSYMHPIIHHDPRYKGRECGWR